MSLHPGGRLHSVLLSAVALAGAGIMVAGCTYAKEEPGLFGRGPASRSVAPPRPPEPPAMPPTNPALPVLAEEVWTSADGLDVRVRIAVHAVRRIAGATVLDWSITPLRAPNLRPGDAVPTVDLGLSRPADELPRIYLLDSRNSHLYRPLVNPVRSTTCVCTPLSVAQRRLEIGRTTLLQVAFPELPAATSAIDVVIATVSPFGQVPVTRADYVPVAAGRTQLGRPADNRPSTGPYSDMFRYGSDEQIFRLQANRIASSGTFTALEWTIWSVTGGAGLDAASSPPFAEPDRIRPADAVTASGPVLALPTARGERTLRTRLVRSDADDGTVECLCSSLQDWTSLLQRPDKPVTVVTTYPPLPAGTDRVQVQFGDLGSVSLPVTRAPDAKDRLSGERPWPRTTWRPSTTPTRGWTADDWPAPVPAADQLPESASPYALVR